MMAVIVRSIPWLQQLDQKSGINYLFLELSWECLTMTIIVSIIIIIIIIITICIVVVVVVVVVVIYDGLGALCLPPPLHHI